MPSPSVKQPPFASLVGINITHVSPERVAAELTVRDDLTNGNGILHGGAIMTLADNLGGTATMANLQAGPTACDDMATGVSGPFRTRSGR